MSIFKCKMCGGALEVAANETVATCEYCGTQQTLPKLDDDKRANMYDRANHFRRNNEFDKAMGIYEQILNEDNTDAEAYWSLVLCRYGIEYVEDPATHKRVPTVNRAQFTSIFDDDNYKSALKNADTLQKMVYESEAKAINEIQKGILAISQKEEPFDVFICYKETDNGGRRTPDSVLANDLYHQLTQEGFKVFFSRITLEDKLGTAYEPYIFAALNSAKVMVVLGTKPEFFNAVWVKNEWSRYLALVRQSAGKKMLIPAYKDMDPYDLPEEFSHLQAQDMSKLGFMQDLIRGIKKIISVDAPAPIVKETVVVNNTAAPTNTNTAPLLKRAFMFLEDGDFNGANEYAEKVLDIDPECAEAYLVKLMAETGTRKREALKNLPQSFEGSMNCQKLMRFGDEALEKEIRGYIEHINERNETARKEDIYQNALSLKRKNTPNDYDEAIKLLVSVKGYKDAEKQIEDCNELKKEFYYLKGKNQMSSGDKNSFRNAIESFSIIKGYKDTEKLIEECKELEKEYYYLRGKKQMSSETVYSLQNAINSFFSVKGYKDADALLEECESKIKQINAEEEAKAEKAKKKKIKFVKIVSSIVAVVIIFVILLNTVIIPTMDYNKAVALMKEKKYNDAIAAFEAMDGYKDSADKIKECNYGSAVMLMEEKKYDEAIAAFKAMNDYKDSANQIENCYIAKYGKNIYEMIKSIKIGDIYTFGKYEQDNNTSNGKDNIEWIVVDKNETTLLLVCKYALDCKQYNTTYSNVSWQTCTLRKWLNNDFINNAFSKEEKAKIQTVEVSADKNPEYGTNPGNATQDKVFLLSIAEAEKYFTTDEARKCVPTAYAKAQGANTINNETSDGKATCWWWLRSPGDKQDCAVRVHDDGSIYYTGGHVDNRFGGIRPAMWITLNS